MVTVYIEDGLCQLVSLAEKLGWHDEFGSAAGGDWSPEEADAMESSITEYLEERGIKVVMESPDAEPPAKKLVRKLLTTIVQNGWYFAIFSEDELLVARTQDVERGVKDCDAAMDCRIEGYIPGSSKAIGWAWVIFPNDWDALSDYGTKNKTWESAMDSVVDWSNTRAG